MNQEDLAYQSTYLTRWILILVQHFQKRSDQKFSANLDGTCPSLEVEEHRHRTAIQPARGMNTCRFLLIC